MATESTRQKGIQAEELAADVLRGKGYKILAQNWTAGKLEFDLIASNQTHIVFVEVKYRSTANYGAPWEAVNSAKRKLVVRAADLYLQRNEVELEPRFDIISIVGGSPQPSIEHFEGAFFPYA